MFQTIFSRKLVSSILAMVMLFSSFGWSAPVKYLRAPVGEDSSVKEALGNKDTGIRLTHIELNDQRIKRLEEEKNTEFIAVKKKVSDAIEKAKKTAEYQEFVPVIALYCMAYPNKVTLREVISSIEKKLIEKNGKPKSDIIGADLRSIYQFANSIDDSSPVVNKDLGLKPEGQQIKTLAQAGITVIGQDVVISNDQVNKETGWFTAADKSSVGGRRTLEYFINNRLSSIFNHSATKAWATGLLSGDKWNKWFERVEDVLARMPGASFKNNIVCIDGDKPQRVDELNHLLQGLDRNPDKKNILDKGVIFADEKGEDIGKKLTPEYIKGNAGKIAENAQYFTAKFNEKFGETAGKKASFLYGAGADKDNVKAIMQIPGVHGVLLASGGKKAADFVVLVKNVIEATNGQKEGRVPVVGLNLKHMQSIADDKGNKADTVEQYAEALANSGIDFSKVQIILSVEDDNLKKFQTAVSNKVIGSMEVAAKKKTYMGKDVSKMKGPEDMPKVSGGSGPKVEPSQLASALASEDPALSARLLEEAFRQDVEERTSDIHQALTKLVEYRDTLYMEAIGSKDTANIVRKYVEKYAKEKGIVIPKGAFIPGHLAAEAMREYNAKAAPGEKKGIIAVNTLNYGEIRGHLKSAMKMNSAIIIEIAKSQIGTALESEMIVNYVKSVAEELGCDVPIIMHADHNQYGEDSFKQREILEKEYNKVKGEGAFDEIGYVKENGKFITIKIKDKDVKVERELIDIIKDIDDIKILGNAQATLKKNAEKERKEIQDLNTREIKDGFTSIAVDASTMVDLLAGEIILRHFAEKGTKAEKMIVEMEKNFQLPLKWGDGFLKLDPNSDKDKKELEKIKAEVRFEMSSRKREKKEIDETIKGIEECFAVIHREAEKAGINPHEAIAAYEKIMRLETEASVEGTIPDEIKATIDPKLAYLLLPTSNLEETVYQVKEIHKLIKELGEKYAYLVNTIGIEIEGGHIDKKDAKGESKLTNPLVPVVMMIRMLKEKLYVDYNAENNGAGHGTEFDKKNLKPKSQVMKVSPYLTGEIVRLLTKIVDQIPGLSDEARAELRKMMPNGSSMAQHGTSGSDMAELRRLVREEGEIKVNIATIYQQLNLNLYALIHKGLRGQALIDYVEKNKLALVEELHPDTSDLIKELAQKIAANPEEGQLKAGDSIFTELLKRTYLLQVKKGKLNAKSSAEDISLSLAKETKRVYLALDPRITAHAQYGKGKDTKGKIENTYLNGLKPGPELMAQFDKFIPANAPLIAAVEAAVSVVVSGWRGAVVKGTTSEEKTEIKDNVDGLAKVVCQYIFLKYGVKAVIHCSEGVGRDDVELAFRSETINVNGTTELHIFIDVVESTNDTVTNVSGKTLAELGKEIAGGTSAVVWFDEEEGRKLDWSSPDTYMGQLITSVLPEMRDWFMQQGPIDPSAESIAELRELITRLAKANKQEPKDFQIEFVVMKRPRETQRIANLRVLQKEFPGLSLRIIKDGTVNPGLVATAGQKDKHLVVLTVGGSAEALMNLAVAKGFYGDGAIGALEVLSKQTNGTVEFLYKGKKIKVDTAINLEQSKKFTNAREFSLRDIKIDELRQALQEKVTKAGEDQTKEIIARKLLEAIGNVALDEKESLEAAKLGEIIFKRVKEDEKETEEQANEAAKAYMLEMKILKIINEQVLTSNLYALAKADVAKLKLSDEIKNKINKTKNKNEIREINKAVLKASFTKKEIKQKDDDEEAELWETMPELAGDVLGDGRFITFEDLPDGVNAAFSVITNSGSLGLPGVEEKDGIYTQQVFRFKKYKGRIYVWTSEFKRSRKNSEVIDTILTAREQGKKGAELVKDVEAQLNKLLPATEVAQNIGNGFARKSVQATEALKKQLGKTDSADEYFQLLKNNKVFAVGKYNSATQVLVTKASKELVGKEVPKEYYTSLLGFVSSLTTKTGKGVELINIVSKHETKLKTFLGAEKEISQLEARAMSKNIREEKFALGNVAGTKRWHGTGNLKARFFQVEYVVGAAQKGIRPTMLTFKGSSYWGSRESSAFVQPKFNHLILGFGTIGGQVAGRSREMGYNVLAANRSANKNAEAAIELGIPLYMLDGGKAKDFEKLKVEGTLDELLASGEVDVITYATDGETKDPISGKEISVAQLYYQQIHEKYPEIKAVFEGGEDPGIAEKFFDIGLLNVLQVQFEQALQKAKSLFTPSCNTTGYGYVLDRIAANSNFVEVLAIALRRVNDPGQKGKMSPDGFKVDPNYHHAEDYFEGRKGTELFKSFVKSAKGVPLVVTDATTTHMTKFHVLKMSVKGFDKTSEKRLTAEMVKEYLSAEPRIALVNFKKDIFDTTAIVDELFNRMGEVQAYTPVVQVLDSPNGDVSITIAVPQESIVIPNNVSVIDALSGMWERLASVSRINDVIKLPNIASQFEADFKSARVTPKEQPKKKEPAKIAGVRSYSVDELENFVSEDGLPVYVTTNSDVGDIKNGEVNAKKTAKLDLSFPYLEALSRNNKVVVHSHNNRPEGYEEASSLFGVAKYFARKKADIYGQGLEEHLGEYKVTKVNGKDVGRYVTASYWVIKNYRGQGDVKVWFLPDADEKSIINGAKRIKALNKGDMAFAENRRMDANEQAGEPSNTPGADPMSAEAVVKRDQSARLMLFRYGKNMLYGKIGFNFGEADLHRWDARNTAVANYLLLAVGDNLAGFVEEINQEKALIDQAHRNGDNVALVVSGVKEDKLEINLNTVRNVLVKGDQNHFGGALINYAIVGDGLVEEGAEQFLKEREVISDYGVNLYKQTKAEAASKGITVDYPKQLKAVRLMTELLAQGVPSSELVVESIKRATATDIRNVDLSKEKFPQGFVVAGIAEEEIERMFNETNLGSPKVKVVLQSGPIAPGDLNKLFAGGNNRFELGLMELSKNKAVICKGADTKAAIATAKESAKGTANKESIVKAVKELDQTKLTGFKEDSSGGAALTAASLKDVTDLPALLAAKESLARVAKIESEGIFGPIVSQLTQAEYDTYSVRKGEVKRAIDNMGEADPELRKTQFGALLYMGKVELKDAVKYGVDQVSISQIMVFAQAGVPAQNIMQEQAENEAVLALRGELKEFFEPKKRVVEIARVADGSVEKMGEVGKPRVMVIYEDAIDAKKISVGTINAMTEGIKAGGVDEIKVVVVGNKGNLAGLSEKVTVVANLASSADFKSCDGQYRVITSKEELAANFAPGKMVLLPALRDNEAFIGAFVLVKTVDELVPTENSKLEAIALRMLEIMKLEGALVSTVNLEELAKKLVTSKKIEVIILATDKYDDFLRASKLLEKA
ncbi:MAG: class II fructose-bisphosphate aldolase [Elusimicrobiota bacterium]